MANKRGSKKPEVTVTSASDVGGDVLVVAGLRGEEEITATGWVSALGSRFDVEHASDGHRHAEKPPCCDRELPRRFTDGSEEWDELTDETRLMRYRMSVHVEPKARQMTDAEKLDYCRRLLEEGNPRPVDLGISD